ncbi:DEAD/DEAH box helicase [Roseobacteraceae bacterium NS-SX3]
MKQTLAEALERRGYTSLTPVQEAVTDPALAGADMLVSAQTGSGKTVGFGLAIAPAVLGDEDRFGPAALPLALVIAPTRELALQVKRELGWLYGEAGAVVASCVGGMDMRDERRALERGAHIVVATPGRLRDHIMRGSISLEDLRAVVLDEADEMLDLGFREDLEFILGEAPEERQTLLFSATVPRAIAELAKSYQRDAERVSTVAEKSQHADITYLAMPVALPDAEKAVINVLRFYEAPNAIVFCNTRAMVNRMVTRLSNRGFSVVALSGELTQAERSHALQAMRDGRARVCVATDVAARGIDLPNLDLVVHAELPSGHETLLHRSGRTGRAGRKGVSALIVPPKARKKAERLLKSARLTADWSPAPSAEAVGARDEERMLADPVWQEAPQESELALVEKLAGEMTPAQLAAGFLRLWKSGRSAPEELGDPGEKPGPREPFGPSVWFSIAAGRNQGADPRRLLPMLCRAGGLSKGDIGAIRIQPEETFAEILESRVAAFLETLGPDMALDDGTRLTRLEEAPAAVQRAPGKPQGKKPHHRGQASGPRGPRAPYRKDDRPQRRPEERSGSGDAAAPKRAEKPRWKAADKPGDRPAARRHEGAHSPAKPAYKGKGKDKPFAKEAGKGKGPKPPAGKPTSKKNKARTLAAAKAGKPQRGGNAVPRRKGS